MAGQDPDLGRWPSIEHAYAFVLASYDWTLRRMDAQDARLRQIGMAAATIALGAPVAVASLARDGSLGYWWLYVIGAGLGAIVTIAALVGHTLKHLTLLSVQDLWEQNLGKDPMEFQKDQIFAAAERQITNNQVIERRGQLAVWLAVAFGVEVVTLSAWISLNLAGARSAVLVCQSG